MGKMADAERLERYERFSAGVRSELSETRAKMAELRGKGRVKTATYQQLFANRSILERIDERLRDLGL